MSTPFDDERYISLETFKKDGNGVKTPVWTAPLDGKLVVFTDGTSYKVKRIRRNTKCRVAGCNSSGAKIHTEWKDGTARIIEDKGEAERAHAALRKKYGILMGLADVGSKLFGRIGRRAYLEISF
jgi:hypothetical protein